jgi:AcrR family transcriptional regulator
MPAGSSDDPPPLSLRERKRMRTMSAIQEAALRLFAEQGFDRTTVEQIAAAAEVSPATFFRYYPSKEAVLGTDEFDELVERILRERPPEEDMLDALRGAMRAVLPYVEQSRESILGRTRLVMQTPGLRSQFYEAQQANIETLAKTFAPRIGLGPDDFEMRVIASALSAALMTAAFTWAEDGGNEDLGELFERALDVLEHLTEYTLRRPLTPS